MLETRASSLAPLPPSTGTIPEVFSIRRAVVAKGLDGVRFVAMFNYY